MSMWISANNELIVIASALLFCAILLGAFAANGILVEWRERQPSRPARPPALPRPPAISLEDNILQRFARFVTPATEEEHSEARLRLARAGYRRPSAVRIFHLTRAASAVAFMLAAAVSYPFVIRNHQPLILFAFIFVSFIVGFLLPSLLLERRIASRKRTAEEGFPDTLDMLLVCIEAGQSFEQASRRIARELKGHNDVLAEEMGILNDEMWAGKDRATVFRDFSQRLNVTDITAFISVLRQADQFGVSVAEAIRVYAADMRYKRVMRAEESANTMPLKLALASMFFTVPPIMIIMVGPSLLEIIRTFTRT